MTTTWGQGGQRRGQQRGGQQEGQRGDNSKGDGHNERHDNDGDTTPPPHHPALHQHNSDDKDDEWDKGDKGTMTTKGAGMMWADGTIDA